MVHQLDVGATFALLAPKPQRLCQTPTLHDTCSLSLSRPLSPFSYVKGSPNFLGVVDKFTDSKISAYVTPGLFKFILLHPNDHTEGIKMFFEGVHELHVKVRACCALKQILCSIADGDPCSFPTDTVEPVLPGR